MAGGTSSPISRASRRKRCSASAVCSQPAEIGGIGCEPVSLAHGWSFSRCVGELARRLAAGDRPGLAQALGAWLKPGTGTRALIALRLAGRCGGGRDPWMIDEPLGALGP